MDASGDVSVIHTLFGTIFTHGGKLSREQKKTVTPDLLVKHPTIYVTVNADYINYRDTSYSLFTDNSKQKCCCIRSCKALFHVILLAEALAI